MDSKVLIVFGIITGIQSTPIFISEISPIQVYSLGQLLRIAKAPPYHQHPHHHRLDNADWYGDGNVYQYGYGNANSDGRFIQDYYDRRGYGSGYNGQAFAISNAEISNGFGRASSGAGALSGSFADGRSESQSSSQSASIGLGPFQASFASSNSDARAF